MLLVGVNETQVFTASVLINGQYHLFAPYDSPVLLSLQVLYQVLGLTWQK